MAALKTDLMAFSVKGKVELETLKLITMKSIDQ